MNIVAVKFRNTTINVNGSDIKINKSGEPQCDDETKIFLLNNFPKAYKDLDAIVEDTKVDENKEVVSKSEYDELIVKVQRLEESAKSKDLKIEQAEAAVKDWKKVYEEAKNSVPTKVKEGITPAEIESLYDLSKSSKKEMQEMCKNIEEVKEEDWAELNTKELFVLIASKTL